ncbi:MAG TPA: DUF6174 domain-containing protein [Terriglobia bacterium]
MKRAISLALCLFLLAGCGRLPALTAPILEQAEQKWSAHKPGMYRLVIEMSGDRVETGRFEVQVRAGQVVSFRRNGMVLQPDRGQDYTMEGLFHILEEELGLAEKPTMLGAPEGYTVYTTAKFDDVTGRLIRYRRIVGGASNSIDIKVVEYQTLG